MIRLHTITIDVRTIPATIEVLHVEEVFDVDGVTLLELRPIRRVNYSSAQYDEVVQALGERAQRAMIGAGWIG